MYIRKRTQNLEIDLGSDLSSATNKLDLAERLNLSES